MIYAVHHGFGSCTAPVMYSIRHDVHRPYCVAGSMLMQYVGRASVRVNTVLEFVVIVTVDA